MARPQVSGRASPTERRCWPAHRRVDEPPRGLVKFQLWEGDTASQLPRFGPNPPSHHSMATSGPSRTFGRYELVTEIAASYLGPLSLARAASGDETNHLAFARRVRLPARSPQEIVDHLSEAAWTALEIEHELVFRVLEVLVQDREIGVIQPYIEGVTLRTVQRAAATRRRPIPIEIALRIVEDTARALEGLHAYSSELGDLSGLLYGGLNPDGIFVTTSGCTMLLDPLVGGAAASVDAFRTHPDRVAYTAPEQHETNATVDARSDVFVLGVLLWELLAERRLFMGFGQSVAQKVRMLKIPRLDSLEIRGRPALPVALADLAEQALDRDRARRFASVRVLRETLSGLGMSPAGPGDVRHYVEDVANSELKKIRSLASGPSRRHPSARPTAPRAPARTPAKRHATLLGIAPPKPMRGPSPHGEHHSNVPAVAPATLIDHGRALPTSGWLPPVRIPPRAAPPPAVAPGPTPATAEPTVPGEPTYVPAQPAPVPAELPFTPAQPTPVPTEPPFAPVQPTPVPAEPPFIPAQPAPVLGEPTDVPAQPVPAPGEPTDVPAQPTPVPAEPSFVPAEPAPMSAQPTPAPAVVAPVAVPTAAGRVEAPRQPELTDTAFEAELEAVYDQPVTAAPGPVFPAGIGMSGPPSPVAVRAAGTSSPGSTALPPLTLRVHEQRMRAAPPTPAEATPVLLALDAELVEALPSAAPPPLTVSERPASSGPAPEIIEGGDPAAVPLVHDRRFLEAPAGSRDSTTLRRVLVIGGAGILVVIATLIAVVSITKSRRAPHDTPTTSASAQTPSRASAPPQPSASARREARPAPAAHASAIVPPPEPSVDEHPAETPTAVAPPPRRHTTPHPRPRPKPSYVPDDI